MKGVEPYLQEALQKVEKLKEEEQARNKALEATIDMHRGDLARRRAAADASESGHSGSLHQRGSGEPPQVTSTPAISPSMHDLLPCVYMTSVC